MMISTRGRYALRVLIDLAENDNGTYTAMKEVAGRQRISLKYLEKILPVLVSAKMIEGTHGKGGGYKLTKKPSEYIVGDVLRLTEGDIVPVACLECDAKPCEFADECRTLPMWTKLSGIVNDYLDSVTILDLMRK